MQEATFHPLQPSGGAGSSPQEPRALRSRMKPSRLGAEASCISTPSKVHSHSSTTPSQLGLSGFFHSLYLRSLFRILLFLRTELPCWSRRLGWEQKATPCPSARALSPPGEGAQEQVFIKSSMWVVKACNTEGLTPASSSKTSPTRCALAPATKRLRAISA